MRRLNELSEHVFSFVAGVAICSLMLYVCYLFGGLLYKLQTWVFP